MLHGRIATMEPRYRVPRRLLAAMLPLYLLVIVGFMSDARRLVVFPLQNWVFSPQAIENETRTSPIEAALESGQISFDVLYKSLTTLSTGNQSSDAQALTSNEQSSDAERHVSNEKSSDAQSLASKEQAYSQPAVSKKKSSSTQSLRRIQNRSFKAQSQNSKNHTLRRYTSTTVLKRNMQKISAGLAQAFLPKDVDAWCTKVGYTTLHKKLSSPDPKTHPFWLKSPTGLLYVKVPKAASSTLAGVVDRIAHNHGGCDFKDSHNHQGAWYYYGNRDKSASFLLGSIRDPASRAISRIFFQQVSQEFQEPTDENMLMWLNSTEISFGSVSEGQGGFQLQYMTLQTIEPWSAYDWNHNTTVKNPKQVEQNVRRVMEEYDFMVVVERMDESLVVLQMLLGVDPGDLLTLDSKVQGSYYYTTSKGCIQLVNSHVSPRVKEYLTSDVWYAQNYGDYLLQAVANASLDRTIEALGRDRVEQGLVEYRKLKKMANEKCASKAIFACSAEGVAQHEKMNCYKGDHGCGYPCVDEMLKSPAIQAVKKVPSSDAQSRALNTESTDADSFIVTLKKNIQKISTGLARAFSPKDLDAWCTKVGYTTLHRKLRSPDPTTHPYWLNSPTGLLYVKVPKAASSTLAGVVDRISHNHGGCDSKETHVYQGVGYFYGNRDKSASFLLGSVRDPAARAISRIFFQQVSQEFQEPTDENMFIWLNDTDIPYGTVSAGQGGFQLQYMYPKINRIEQWSAYNWNHNTTVKNPKQVEQNVRRVMEEYDFMVVVERMDESLVVLQMLLGVDPGDLLTLDSKVQGSYYYTTSKGCIQLVNSHVSPRVKEYLTSDVWYAQNYGDYLLQAVANASLDRTIEALGRDRVEQGLVEYRKLKRLANEKCASKAFFACSAEGVAQHEKMNCYKGDHGCGYPCIDEMLSSKETALQF